MNIKAAYRYQLEDHKKSILIYYLVVLCVFALMFLTVLINKSLKDASDVNIQLDGIDMATAIFLFVAGLCSFKEAFGMMIQNGISRKTIFISRIVTVLTITFSMALLDHLLSIVFKAISDVSGAELSKSTLYEQLYRVKAAGMGPLNLFAASLLFDFCLFLCLMAAGYLITLLFYRMNKAGKIIISVGVPVGLFTVLPIFDYVITGGRISAAITKFLYFAFGVTNHQPINALITFLIAFLLFSGLSWLLIRRASVRI